MNVNLEISRLVEYALRRGLIAEEDRAYSANRLLALLGAGDYVEEKVSEDLPYPAGPLDRPTGLDPARHPGRPRSV